MGSSAEEERAGMNAQPISMNEPIDAEYLIMLSLEDLEAFFVQITCPDLEKTFHTVSRSARSATQTEAQRLLVIESETHFKQLLEELKAIIHAYIYHAIFADQAKRKPKVREKWR